MNEHPGLHVTVNRSSYAVVGSTVDELRTVLQTLGPSRSGRAFSAYTDWTVDWEFDIKAGMPHARVVNARVCVRAKITLPRWCPPRSASPHILTEWVRYIGALDAHEQGHLQLAVEAGRAVLAQLEALDGDADVGRLRQSASGVAESAVLAVRRQESRYDAVSRHGAAHGAALVDTA